MGEYFEASRPARIERLARIEGQSGFLSLLAGVEAGPDTTQDMAALGMSRAAGAIPEVLEAHAAQSDMFKRPLMSMLLQAVVAELRPKEADLPWIRGTVSDAFLLLRYGRCKPYKHRAAYFCVGQGPYQTVRSLAASILWELLDNAERAWARARFSARDSTGKCHAANERESIPQWMAAMGCYRAGVRRLHDGSCDPYADDEDEGDFCGIAVGIADRLGWDSRQAKKKPAPVLELHGQYAAERIAACPSQPSLRYSLRPASTDDDSGSSHNRPEPTSARRARPSGASTEPAAANLGVRS